VYSFRKRLRATGAIVVYFELHGPAQYPQKFFMIFMTVLDAGKGRE